MTFAIIYRPRYAMPSGNHDVAEWFDSFEAARSKAEKILRGQFASTVAVVKVVERASPEVTWTRF